MSERQNPVTAPKITVIGSINCDFTTFVEDFPVRNQTVMARQFAFNVGGKGLNQAVTAARFGADVSFVGCVGDDNFGRDAISYMHEYNIDTSHVHILENESTGSAGIFVNSAGENMIAVTPGANAGLSQAHVQSAAETIASTGVLLTQLEIPIDTVSYALSSANSASVLSILNPAPMLPNARELLSLANIITPNETEMADLCGPENTVIDADDLPGLKKISSELCALGTGTVITTLGARGCHLYCEKETGLVPSYEVKVVDATGAGDVFNGILATCIAEGQSVQEACKLAVAAAAMSVEKETVCDAAPSRKEVRDFLENRA